MDKTFDKDAIFLALVLPFFSNAFITEDGELILEPTNNIYFRLDDVECNQDLECKLLEWVSRSACKGLSKYWQAYMLRGLRSYFGVAWSKEDMMLIYTKLGNGVNGDLCRKFIAGNYNLMLLR